MPGDYTPRPKPSWPARPTRWSTRPRSSTQHTIGAPETTSGVMRYVENTLACFSHRQVIDLVHPQPGRRVRHGRFPRRERHRLSAGQGREVCPPASALTTAFGEELLFVAGDVIAPTRPGRRLTPPLLACLDEAPRWRPSPPCRCSWPTPAVGGSWSSCRAQSPSQLRTKWSDDETDTMFNASNIQTVFGGLSVDRDLRWMSELAGQRFVMDHTRQSGPDWRSQFSTRWDQTPVLRPDEIRTLRPGHALVMAAANPPVISDLPLIFDTRGRPPSGRRDGRDRHSQRPGPSRPGDPGPGPMSTPWLDEAPRKRPALAVRQLMQPAWTGPAREMPPAGSMADPDYQPGGVWPWDWTAIDARQARRMWTRLRGLVEFLNQRYAWDHTQLIPPCWAFHGGLVEELTTLYWSRWAAFSGPGRQRRPGPELAHLSPARLLPAHEHVVRGAAQPDPMPERPAPAAPPAHRRATGWRSGARPPPMWPNWTRICGRSRPSDMPIWPPSPRLHPAIRPATMTGGDRVRRAWGGTAEGRGHRVAGETAHRPRNRRPGTVGQLGRRAAHPTGLAERNRRRSPREGREGLRDRPAGLRVALHHRASDPDPDPVLTRPVRVVNSDGRPVKVVWTTMTAASSASICSGSRMPQTPPLENQASRWAYRARMHYREYLPDSYRGIEDKDRYFSELGQQAMTRIEAVYEQISRPGPEVDLAALKQAEETVGDLVYPDPEPGHEEGWGEPMVAETDEEYEQAEDMTNRLD